MLCSLWRIRRILCLLQARESELLMAFGLNESRINFESCTRTDQGLGIPLQSQQGVREVVVCIGIVRKTLDGAALHFERFFKPATSVQ